MKKTLLATLALTLALTGAAFSQTNSTLDTVYLSIDASDEANGVTDGAFTCNVWISIDSTISGATLGFLWDDTANWKLDSVVYGPTINWEILPALDTIAANARGSALLGGAAIFATTAAGDGQLFATMYFSAKNGGATWTSGKEMLIDSVYVDPGGEFIMVRASSTNIRPIFRGAQKVTFSDVHLIEDAALPSVFSVSQNYPNPFNPSTKIDVSIPERSLVTAEVFNLLGQKVKTLMSDEYAPGVYKVTWEGDNDAGSKVASGVYFYKVTAGNFVKTHKMMLMK